MVTPGTTQLPKHTLIADALRRRIREGVIPVGERVPTMKALSREFGVSVPTVFRAMRRLAHEGLIESNANPKGTVVISDRPLQALNQTTLGCLLRAPHPRNDEDNFILDIFEGLREAVSARSYRFILHGLDEQDYEARVTELVKARAVSGLILDQKTPERVARRLAGLGLPAVMLNRSLDAPNLSCVTPDYEGLGRQAVRLFLRQGYERVGFHSAQGFRPEDEEATAANAPFVALHRGLHHAARAVGLGDGEVVPVPAATTREVVHEPETYGLPRRKGLDWRPMGVLCLSDTYALALLGAIERTDLMLGTDIGVLSGIALERGRRAARPPTAAAVDRRRVGLGTVSVLLERIEDPDIEPRTELVPMEIVDRGTV